MVVANLPARKVAGINSDGMILAATVSEPVPASPECSIAPASVLNQLCLLTLPDGVIVGESLRVVCIIPGQTFGPAASRASMKRHKYERALFPDFRTDGDGVCLYKSFPCLTSKGPIMSKVRNGQVTRRPAFC